MKIHRQLISKTTLAFITAGLLTASVTVLSAETKHTGRFATISNIAFQGEIVTDYGWPVKVSSIEEAIKNARKWGINAFHVYIIGDMATGQMYPFRSVTGYEVREGNRQSIGVIMERTSVHQ
jgi:hypothetical protein